MTSVKNLPVRTTKLLDSIVLINVNDLLSFNQKSGLFNVTSRIPDNDVLDKIIFTFSFPDSDFSRSTKKEEKFTFILTDEHGKKRFCHCKRVVFSRSWCICIISSHSSYRLFGEILELLSTFVDNQKIFNVLLQDLYNKDYPPINGYIRNDATNSHIFTYRIQRGNDKIYEPGYTFPSKLLELFGGSLFVDMLSNLLLERKFMFISESLEVLSWSINTFSRLIYPFEWQHILIPILPSSMSSLAHAPMPFIIGCTSSCYLQLIEEVDLSDVYVFNLDRNTFISYPDYPIMLTSDRSIILRNIMHRIQKMILADQTKQMKKSTDEIINEEILDFYRYSFSFYTETLVEEIDPQSNTMVRKFKLKNSKSNPDKTGRDFFQEFLKSQMSEMYFVSRERDVMSGKNLKILCPLLGQRKKIKRHEMALNHGFDNPKCCFCNLTIPTSCPCSVCNNLPCHTACYRCKSCFRVMAGDNVKKQTMVCRLCEQSNSPLYHRTEKDYQNMLSRKSKITFSNISALLPKSQKMTKSQPSFQSPRAPQISPTIQSDSESLDLFDLKSAVPKSSSATSFSFDFLSDSPNLGHHDDDLLSMDNSSQPNTNTHTSHGIGNSNSFSLL
ncbi:UDENN domain-containing protein [Entamoeba marina]